MSFVPFGLLPPGRGENSVVKRIGRPFEKGNKYGGRRPGKKVTPRTKSARSEFAKEFEKAQGAQVLGRILSGDILEDLGRTENGEQIVGSTKNSDRIKAAALMSAYAYGLPKQTIEATDADGQPIAFAVFMLPRNGREIE